MQSGAWGASTISSKELSPGEKGDSPRSEGNSPVTLLAYSLSSDPILGKLDNSECGSVAGPESEFSELPMAVLIS